MSLPSATIKPWDFIGDEDMNAKEITSVCRIRAVRDRDLVLVTAAGVLRRATHGALRAAIHEELLLGEARAVVVDLRGVVSTLSDEARHMVVADSVADPKAPKIPVALVVTEVMFEPTVRQCAVAWGECRLWVPFLDLEDAKDWARTLRPHWRPAGAVATPRRQMQR